ncbi:MAG: class I SAM-dependent methyltransferase [Chloracidobacterium sp.]|nr:class I SAM-dependent methyltransferase [Chloracidobacterium sp.]
MIEDEQYYAATKTNFLRTLAAAGDTDDIRERGRRSQGVERVLDIGCGIGQALYPLAVADGIMGVGVDVSEESLRIGRRSTSRSFPEARISFVRSMAESLPFEDESFDLVNCGLALPYWTMRGQSRKCRG